MMISRSFARPLKALVGGVRSLESGDFAYPLDQRGDDEVAEVTRAFDRMRQSLHKTQQQLLESERMATIGTMAGSISHDLRHALTAVVANAEFLCGMQLDRTQREDLYQEIRLAVNQMTELLESLLEFSRTRASLSLSYGNLEEIVRRAVAAVRIHPHWQRIEIKVISETPVCGWLDEKKLQRVFYNLLLNACEAVREDNGRVEVLIRKEPRKLQIRVRDNGCGIPDAIRDRLFRPFVSSGKQNGTGMGLAVVQKIVQEHGGEICVESTSAEGTVFVITLPERLHTQNSSEEIDRVRAH
jgi:signal transduction histidine kinase